MSAAEDSEFLTECLYQDGVYRIELGGSRPSSIRDQLEKATRFVRAIKQDGDFGVGGNLLILGAGVAGVSAAWAASQAGLNVTLTDARGRPFFAQEECSTRYLHPNEYRWPEPDFACPRFPPDDADARGIPEILHWEAGLPTVIVSRWRWEFYRWIGRRLLPSQGSVNWRTDLPPVPEDSDDLMPYFESVGLGTDFDAVLLCLGGREKCSAPESSLHRGFFFWEDDDYGKADYGAPAGSAMGLRTLISGSGDGALQDFLRIACQQQQPEQPVHALWIFEQLQPALESCEAFQRLHARLGRLDNPARPGPGKMVGLMDDFLRELEASPQRADLERRLDALIDPALLDGRKILHVNVGNSLYEKAYAMNALLAGLFEWRIRLSNQLVLYPGARLLAVRAAIGPHACAGKPGRNGCLLKPHLATFDRLDGGTGRLLTREYHVLVIRHGIEPPLGAPPAGL